MNEQIATCSIIVIGLTIYISYRGFCHPSFMEKYIFNPESILARKQYYRLISSGFLHANWPHLLFNMFSLYAFGSAIEYLFGVPCLLIVYFSSMLGGGLLSLYLHRHHNYRALGASGGVCGVIFSCIFLVPGSSVYVFPLPVAIPASLYAIMFVIISYLGIRHGGGDTGHDAHLGGAIIGLLSTTLLHPWIIRVNPVLYSVVISLSVVLFILLYLQSLRVAMSPTARLDSLKEKMSQARIQKAGARHQRDEAIFYSLLQQISKSGTASLTKHQRKQLKEISQQKQNDAS